jgi:hypothetical protein
LPPMGEFAYLHVMCRPIVTTESEPESEEDAE